MATETLNITAAQMKTLNAIRETICIFSDTKEDAEMIIKRKSRTTLKVCFEINDERFFQYKISSSGAIVEMAEVEGFKGGYIEEFEL